MPIITRPHLHSNAPASPLLRARISILRPLVSVSVQVCPDTDRTLTLGLTLSPVGQRPAVSCWPPVGGGRALRARSGRPSAGRCCGPPVAARLATLARVAAPRPQDGLPEGLAMRARPSLAARELAMRWRGRRGAARWPLRQIKAHPARFSAWMGQRYPQGLKMRSEGFKTPHGSRRERVSHEVAG